MPDKKDDAAEAERTTHENAENKAPAAATTATAPEPPATGPAFQLIPKDSETPLANMRLESIRTDGEPTAPKDLAASLKKAKEDGAVVITAIAHPTAGGEEQIRNTIGSRAANEMTLKFNDHEATGLFRINRMDHCGEPFGERGYIVTLESAEKPKED